MNNDGMHTVILPLQDNARDSQIMGEALSVVGKLHNAALLSSRLNKSDGYFDAT